MGTDLEICFCTFITCMPMDVHPETMDEDSDVFIGETSKFFKGSGNQKVARRRSCLRRIMQQSRAMGSIWYPKGEGWSESQTNVQIKAEIREKRCSRMATN